MNNQKASDVLRDIATDINDFCHAGKHWSDKDKEELEALYMAIKSLEQKCPGIIRCKNCRHDNNCEIQYSAQAGSEFFCGLGERKEK